MASKHPNSLANLKGHEFKKGNKLGGRKKGSISLTDSLKRALEMECEQINEYTNQIEKRQLRDWVGIALVAKAMKGDVPAIKEVLDRMEGKATQKLEVSGTDGGPLAMASLGSLDQIYTNMKQAFGTTIEAETVEAPAKEKKKPVRKTVKKGVKKA